MKLPLRVSLVLILSAGIEQSMTCLGNALDSTAHALREISDQLSTHAGQGYTSGEGS
jgi:hypothetical protein